MKKEQAIALAKSGWWKTKTDKEIVEFQLYERLLCMDFSEFHRAVESVLDRPVWTHEFGSTGVKILQKEFEGKIPKRTVRDSMELLQELVGDKKIIVVTSSNRSEGRGDRGRIRKRRR